MHFAYKYNLCYKVSYANQTLSKVTVKFSKMPHIFRGLIQRLRKTILAIKSIRFYLL